MSVNNLILSVTNPENKYVIDQDVLSRYREYKKECSSSYELTPKQHQLLHSAGIPTDPHGVQPHPHPACATIEKHSLKLVFQHLQGNPVSLYSIKNHKVPKEFKNRREFCNIILEPKDLHRYPESDDIHWTNKSTTFGFIHDSIHHASFQDILTLFDRHPELQRLYATIVYPPELMVGTKNMHPEIYDFRSTNQGFLFYPDGDSTGVYEQSHFAKELLLHSQIRRADTTITIGLISSFFAHHTLLFTRGSTSHSETRGFGSKSHTLVHKHWFWTKGSTYSIPTLLVEKLQNSILRASSYTMPQLYNRCVAISQENHLQIDPETLVVATNYCLSHTLPYRDHIRLEYPITSWHHIITRNTLSSSFRFFFSHPDLLSQQIGLLRLRRSDGRIVVRAGTVHISNEHQEGPALKPISRRQQIGEVAGGIYCSLVGCNPKKPVYHPYSPYLLFTCFFTRFPFIYLFHASVTFLGQIPIHFQAVLWYIFFSPLILALALFLRYKISHFYFLACEFVSQCIDELCLLHPALTITHTNLLSLLSHQQTSVFSIKRYNDTESQNSGKKIGKLHFSRGDFTSISPLRKSLQEGITNWRNKMDPLKSFTYIKTLESSNNYPSHTCEESLLQKPEEHIGLALILCSFGHFSEQVIIQVFRVVLFHSLTLFVDNKDERGALIHYAREEGLDVFVDCDGFGQLDAAITFTRTNIPVQSRLIQFPADRLPEAHGTQETSSISSPLEEENQSETHDGQGDETSTHPEAEQNSAAARRSRPGSPGSLNVLHDYSKPYRQPKVPPIMEQLQSENFQNRTLLPSPPCTPRFEPTGEELKGPGPRHETGCHSNSQRQSNDCYISALSNSLCLEYDSLRHQLISTSKDLEERISNDWTVDLETLGTACSTLGYHLEIHQRGLQTLHLGAHLIKNRGTALLDYFPDDCHLTSCTCSIDPITGLTMPTNHFELNKQRMADYVRLLRNDNFGLFLSRPENRAVKEQLNAEVDHYSGEKFEYSLILGQPGSGKSSSFMSRFIHWLHGPRDTRWIVAYPSTDVRDRVKNEIEKSHPSLKNFGGFMPTREMAFKSSSHVDVLCIDELGRWYPGEAELLVLRLKPKRLILNGDPLQGRFPFGPVQHSAVGNHPSLLDVLLPRAQIYIQDSYRLPSNWSFIYGFPCHGSDAPIFTRLKFITPGTTILVANQDAQSTLGQTGYRSMTFGTSQGWDSKERYCIYLNEASGKSDDNQLYSAITRSQKGFDVYVEPRLNKPNSNQLFRPGSIAQALFHNNPTMLRQALVSHRASSLPVSLQDPLNNTCEMLAGKRKELPLAVHSLDEPLAENYDLSQPDLERFLNLVKECPSYREIEPPTHFAGNDPFPEDLPDHDSSPQDDIPTTYLDDSCPIRDLQVSSLNDHALNH